MTSVPEPTKSAPGIAAWRILVRGVAAFVALFIFSVWAAAGWNLGLTTTTRIAIAHTNPILYKDHFMPGIEVLALGWFACAVIFALTCKRRT
ncbi:MAG: hypothetical protein WC205_17715 [Opitutaceae bacterium]|jgi:hypothetical protein